MSYTPDQDTRAHLLEMWKKGQGYLKKFWKSWLTEYLPSLRERYNAVMKAIKGEVDRKPKIGEIVIVKEEDLPRGRWEIVRVQNLSEVDGLERAAKLQFSSGRTSSRPLRLLYPLEYEVDDNGGDNEIMKKHSNVHDEKYNDNVEDEIEEDTTKARHKTIKRASIQDRCSIRNSNAM